MNTKNTYVARPRADVTPVVFTARNDDEAASYIADMVLPPTVTGRTCIVDFYRFRGDYLLHRGDVTTSLPGWHTEREEYDHAHALALVAMFPMDEHDERDNPIDPDEIDVDWEAVESPAVQAELADLRAYDHHEIDLMAAVG